MRDRGIPVDVVGAAPEEQIAGPKRVELEGIFFAAHNCIEISRFANPDILLAGIARHIGEAILLKNVINKSGTIHAAVFGIGRAIAVTEILFRQREPSVDDLAYFRRITLVFRDFIR